VNKPQAPIAEWLMAKDLSSVEVACQVRSDVVLESRRSGDQCAEESGVSKGVSQGTGDVGRVAQVQGGIDVGVKDPANGSFLADRPRRDLGSGDLDLGFERRDFFGGRFFERHDHREGAFGVFVEVTDQYLVGLRRVRAGHCKGRREQSRQSCSGERAN